MVPVTYWHQLSESLVPRVWCIVPVGWNVSDWRSISMAPYLQACLFVRQDFGSTNCTEDLPHAPRLGSFQHQRRHTAMPIWQSIEPVSWRLKHSDNPSHSDRSFRNTISLEGSKSKIAQSQILKFYSKCTNHFFISTNSRLENSESDMSSSSNRLTTELSTGR